MRIVGPQVVPVLAACCIVSLLALGACQVVIRRLRRRLARAEYEATHDDLTDLPNRRAAYTYAQALLSTGRAVSVAVIDVDDFKTINDSHTHQAGDQALRYVAQRISAADLPPASLLARIAGDEFAIVVDGGIYAALTAANAALDNLRETKLTVGDQPIDVNVSIGVAVADDTSSLRELLRRADHALYNAKRGPFRVVAWQPDMTMPTPAEQACRRAYRGTAY